MDLDLFSGTTYWGPSKGSMVGEGKANWSGGGWPLNTQ